MLAPLSNISQTAYFGTGIPLAGNFSVFYTITTQVMLKSVSFYHGFAAIEVNMSG